MNIRVVQHYLYLAVVAALACGCAPKFNHTPLAAIEAATHGFILTANPLSPQFSGQKSASSTSAHFSLSKTQFGQPVAVTAVTSAHFSLSTKSGSP